MVLLLSFIDMVEEFLISLFVTIDIDFSFDLAGLALVSLHIVYL